MRLPSGANTALQTESVWPWTVASGLPSPSHSRAVLSSAVGREHRTPDRVGVDWAWRSRLSTVPFRRTQSCPEHPCTGTKRDTFVKDCITATFGHSDEEAIDR
jgi:hypothetical protein